MNNKDKIFKETNKNIIINYHIDETFKIINSNDNAKDLNSEKKTFLNKIFKIDYDKSSDLKYKEIFVLIRDNKRSFQAFITSFENLTYTVVLFEISERMIKLRKITHELRNITNITSAIIFLHAKNNKLSKIINSLEGIHKSLIQLIIEIDNTLILK